MAFRHLAELAVFGLLATLLARAATPARTQPRPIRPAGRKEMENPPERWDIVDERDDESFPASDPPGGY